MRTRHAMGIWGAGLLLLWALGPCVPVETGEPGPLRWARKAREHPVRSALALGLVLAALARPGTTPEPATGRDPRPPREGDRPPGGLEPDPRLGLPPRRQVSGTGAAPPSSSGGIPVRIGLPSRQKGEGGRKCHMNTVPGGRL